LLIRVVELERGKMILRRYRGALGPAPRHLPDRFMLEAEEQNAPPRR